VRSEVALTIIVGASLLMSEAKNVAKFVTAIQ
jgi:hypothetical protein